MPQESLIRFRIHSIIAETPDTSSFILENETGETIHYAAGQFLTFVFFKPNGEQERRNYSIASSPVLPGPLKITVKRIPNGAYSRWLVDEARPGDILLSTGVAGFFTLPQRMPAIRQLVFFAAGSGITPVFSMISTVLQQHSTSVLLIYSNPSPARTIFYDELKKLQESFPGRLQIDFLFSSSAEHPRRRLNIYYIEMTAQRYAQSKNNMQFYLCGPVDYMRMITIILRTEGVPENSIRKEIFHVEKPANKPVPPDTSAHKIEAVIGQQSYSFMAQYPVTILQAAKTLQIPMPYSCEAGQCGTCAATCISGKVWMWRNDVLLDDEIAQGRVLTCTGYAIGGDVVLRY
jgi:ferredoxin-NADP reductase